MSGFSICHLRNIRNFSFLKHEKVWEILRNFFSVYIPWTEVCQVFWKFHFRKYRNGFNLTVRKFPFPQDKEFCSGLDFFFFFGLGFRECTWKPLKPLLTSLENGSRNKDQETCAGRLILLTLAFNLTEPLNYFEYITRIFGNYEKVPRLVVFSH